MEGVISPGDDGEKGKEAEGSFRFLLARFRLMITRTKQSVLLVAALLAVWIFLGGPADRDVEATTAQTAQSRALASFPHEKPKHKTLECSKCHSVTPAQPEVEKFPGHASCSSCHNLALESLTKPVLFCGICHDGRPVSRNRSALFRFPKPQVESDFGADFSHPAHMKPLQTSGVDGMSLLVGGEVIDLSSSSRFESQLRPGETQRCTDCHRKVEPARVGAPEMTVDTGHRVCFQCHSERPIKPPSMNQCAECHLLDGSQAPGLFGLVKDFKHADHEFEIRSRKKKDYAVARPPDFLCRECHQSVVVAETLGQIKLPEENYCGQCHNGRIGLPDALAQDVLESLRKR